MKEYDKEEFATTQEYSKKYLKFTKNLTKMGKLLSLLARDDQCCTPKSYDVFLDFENAQPTDLEREVYDEVERVLRDGENILEEIQIYKVRLMECAVRCAWLSGQMFMKKIDGIFSVEGRFVLGERSIIYGKLKYF